MEKYVLIVAGGKGLRMKSELPKQFIEINNKPVLMHTFDAFSSIGNINHFILVLATEYIGYWEELCERHHFKTEHIVIEGGPKRYHSVKKGLSLIPTNSLVAIHDAARPFISKSIIDNGFDVAARKGNAIPAVAINESIRKISGSLSKSVNRERFKIVQTPQFFQSAKIKKAYEQAFNEKFTDDANILESSGKQVCLIEGDIKNIKITHPEDLVYAESLLKLS